MYLIDEPAAVFRSVGVIRVTGGDRLAYLHTQLSQNLEDLAPGDAADFLYLDAKGAPRAVGRAIAADDAVLLVVPAEIGADLAQTLDSYTFLMDAGAELVDGWVRASARGPEGVHADGAPDEPMRATLAEDLVVVRDRSGGVDWLGTPTAVEGAVIATGLPVADEDAWEAWRVHAGEPAWGRDIVTGRRAQELGLLPTHVHLRKGCYPGQESIAKTYNLGRPRRALFVVTFDGPVASGDRVQAGDKEGEVTSAAATSDGWLALCLLPLDREGQLRGAGEVAVGDAKGSIARRVGEGLPQPGA